MLIKVMILLRFHMLYVDLVSSCSFFLSQSKNETVFALFCRLNGITNLGRKQWKPLIFLAFHQLDTIIT